MDEQVTTVAKFFADNGIAIFWELQCEKCRVHSSVLATMTFDMTYNHQDIFDIGLKNGFKCKQCGTPYTIGGLRMWTNHGSFRTPIIVPNKS